MARARTRGPVYKAIALINLCHGSPTKLCTPLSTGSTVKVSLRTTC